MFRRKNVIFFVALIIEISMSVNGWTDTAEDVSSNRVMIISIKRVGNDSTIDQMMIRNGTCNPTRRNATVSLSSEPSKKSKLVVLDKAGNILYEMKFVYPEFLTVPMLPPGNPGDNAPPVIPMDNPKISLVIPFFSKADEIHLFDGSGKTPSSSKSVQEVELKEAEFEKETPPVATPSQPGMFNVLIIASGYNTSNINNFQIKAEAIKNLLINVEPFKSYTSKIDINIYKNYSELGCYSGCNNIERLMCCDQNSVVSAASASGYYYDEIIVIHNTSVFSGCGYRENSDGYKINSYNTYCAVYDGPYSDVMSLHEFGHSFGNLCDEYSYDSEAYDYYACVNCRSNCSDWSDTGSTLCQQGCDAESSYYRPEDSIMLTFDISNFNSASIYATYSPDGLKERLSYFTTSSECPPCLGDNVVLDGSTFPSGMTCGCTGDTISLLNVTVQSNAIVNFIASTSITVSSGTTFQNGSNSTLTSPIVTFQPGSHVESGAVLNGRP